MTWQFERIGNNPITNLAASCTSGATSITVAGSAAFPAPPFRIMVDSEIMFVTSGTAGTWNVTRGVEGTTAASHAFGARAILAITHDSLFNLFAEPGRGECRLSYSATNAAPAAASGGVLYALPFRGNRLSLQDSDGQWRLVEVPPTGAVQLAVPASSGAMVDVFAYLTPTGVTPFSLEAVVWTDPATRSVAVTQVDGVWTKSGDPTRRLLSTLFTTQASFGLDTAASRDLWNAAAARRDISQPCDFDSRSFSGVTYAPAGNSTANRISFVAGVPGGARVQASGRTSVFASNTASTSWYTLSFGVNATTRGDARIAGAACPYGTCQVTTEHSDTPATPGRYYWQLVEKANVTVTVFGNQVAASPLYQGGITGTHEG